MDNTLPTPSVVADDTRATKSGRLSSGGKSKVRVLAASDRDVLVGRIAELEALLEKCRNTFSFYEQCHRLKCTAEGDEKADRNREFVAMIDAALVSCEGGLWT